MYDWRSMTEGERCRIVALRRRCGQPMHSPPHYPLGGRHAYHLSAANFEHKPIVGKSPERMAAFSSGLLDTLDGEGESLFAWCVLPSHWHALVDTDDLRKLLERIGKLHGRCSFAWNGEESLRGRKCWYCCADRRIRSDRHFQATRNYIHHNPVKHGYVERWDEWVFSSAVEFLRAVGKHQARRLWLDYPVLDMGDKWDFD